VAPSAVSHAIRHPVSPLSARFLVALLQPCCLCCCSRERRWTCAARRAGPQIRVAERSPASPGLARARQEHKHKAGEAQRRGLPEWSNGDDGPGPAAAGPAAPDSILDLARATQIGRSAHPTAPPSHRPYAAPPTGPPVA